MADHGETREFPYYLLPFKLWLFAFFTGVFSILFALGTVYARGGGPFVYGFLFCLTLAGCVTSVKGILRRRQDPGSLQLGETKALLPKASLSGGFLQVPYKDILSVSAQQTAGRKVLIVDTRLGKARVWSNGFLNDARFADFAAVLVAKWKTPALSAKAVPQAVAKPPVNPAEAAVLRAIEAAKASDPLVGAKVAGKEVFLRITSALGKNDPRGVHSETLLCVLGALAGYACQASLRAQALIAGKSANGAFTVVKTKDGKEFFFGDEINRLLAEDKLSVWSLAAGAAQHAGAKTLPDLHEIFGHTAASVGSEAFGVVRYPGAGAAKEPPIAYLRTLWPVLLPPLKELTGDPKLWPLAYALAIQQAIELSKDSLGPEAALTIAMEAAIPMSKVKL